MDRLDPEQRLALRNLAASSAMDGVEVPPEDVEVMACYLLGEITEDQMLQQLRVLHDTRQQRIQQQRAELAAVGEQFAADGYEITEEAQAVIADFLLGEISSEELNERLGALLANAAGQAEINETIREKGESTRGTIAAAAWGIRNRRS